MLQVDYPQSDTQLNLGGILSIEADHAFDTIYLGSPRLYNCLGYIGHIEGNYLFKTHDTDHDFPPRSSYQEALLDLFIYIANDPDHAQEFAVLSMRKVLDSPYEVQ